MRLALEAVGVQRCALRVRTSDGTNKLVRVVEHKHVCAHCGESLWVAEGAEVAHACDPAAVARTQERARRHGLEDARSVAQTQEVTQLKAEIARLNEQLKVVSGT